MTNTNKLSKLISPNYFYGYNAIKSNKFTHYVFKGGRGSCKSSFISMIVPLLMMIDAQNGIHSNGVILRKVKDTCRDSVYTQLLWGIDMLGAADKWEGKVSPLKLTYLPTGQELLFRGCANQRDYEKIKSIKFQKGICKYTWFEELTEFFGKDEINSIIQSLFRGEGNDDAKAFYSYNPPPSKNSWVNEEMRIKRGDRLIHHSTYLKVNPKWIGEIFIKEAQEMKKINEKKYNHMYLGLEVGEGLEIYPNLEIRTITEEEINNFDEIRRGLDFGYSHATCYSEVYYDEPKQTVYVIDEVYKYKASNKMLADAIYKKAGRKYINGDSEDPRTINEMNILGLNVGKARKGKDSKAHGIKWLSDRVKIVIDKKRCPNIASDFETYEFNKDKEGRIIYDYPDEPDGSASVRYALEDIIRTIRHSFI